MLFRSSGQISFPVRSSHRISLTDCPLLLSSPDRFNSMPQGVKVNSASHPLPSYPAIGHSVFWHSPRLSGLADCIPNKPDTVPDSHFPIPPPPGKCPKTPRLGSHGNPPQIRPRLPKYARFLCQITAINRLAAAGVFATYGRPCDPEIGQKNAAIRCVFSDVKMHFFP